MTVRPFARSARRFESWTPTFTPPCSSAMSQSRHVCAHDVKARKLTRRTPKVENGEKTPGGLAICPSRRRFQAVLLHLIDQRATRQAEPAGGARLVLILGFECGDDCS